MTQVGIVYNKNLSYPKYPFNPDKLYPEIKYKYDIQNDNQIYSELRNIFRKLGYDSANFDKKNWNPLGFLINKGDKVLIKPNLVLNNSNYPFSIITHPSIIRFLIDYAYIATGSTGKIIVGDAPQMNANIEEIYKFTKLPNLIQFLQKRKIPVRLIDFRLETIEIKGGVWAGRDKRKGTEVFTIVDLKSDSFLYELEKEKEGNFYGADYNRKIVNYHHNKHRNEYCITTSLLDSDVVISVPKLKTHKKAGVTLNLKNFIGINSHKNYLPHYRIGSPTQKGDAFPNMNPFLNTLKSLKYIFRDWFLSRYDSRLGRFFHRIFNLRKYLEYIIIHAFFPKFKTYYLFLDDGDWCGNDTIWRTVLDLNIILKYANKKGELKDSEQRRLFSVIDGIIAGDKDGPLEPSQKKANIILMGKDLLAIDLVATKIMGFKYQEIPLLKNALTMKKFPISEENNLSKIIVVSNNSDLDNCKYDLIKKNLNFIPPTGWKLLRKN